MPVVYDETHAVDPAKVCGVAKYDAQQPEPFASVWYLAIQSDSGPVQTFRFDSADARDGFYKELVNAMT